MTKKVFRNSLIFFLIVSLTACSSKGIKEINTKDVVYSFWRPHEAFLSESGVFFVRRGNIFYYENGKLGFLTSLNFVDDQPINLEDKKGNIMQNSDVEMKNYRQNIIDSFIERIGDRFFFLSEYEDKSYNKKYYLSSVNNFGKDKTNHIEFKNEASDLYVADGYFVIGSKNGDKYELTKYNSKLKAEKLDIEYQVLGSYKNYLIIDKEDSLQKYNLDTNSLSDLGIKGGLTAIGNGLIAVMDKKNTTNIYDLETGEMKLKFEGEYITSITDENIFSSKVNGQQVYSMYDLNGKLISQIKPGEIFKDEDSDGEETFEKIVVAKKHTAIVGKAKTDMFYYILNFDKASMDLIEVR